MLPFDIISYLNEGTQHAGETAEQTAEDLSYFVLLKSVASNLRCPTLQLMIPLPEGFRRLSDDRIASIMGQ